MRKLLYIIFLCNSFLIYGQINTEITIANLPSVVKPGQHFSILFSVIQPQGSPFLFKNKLILPENWKILAEKTIQTSNDLGAKRFLYTITTPNQGASGNYPIDFQIVSGDTILAEKKARIFLEEVRSLEIIPLNPPEFVKEGDVLRVEYLIQNLGNKTERIKLETSRGVVESNKDSLDIKPNSFAKVFVRQDIPRTEISSWQTSSDLKVSFTNQSMPIFQAVSIPVYSTAIKKNDPYLRFPIEVGGGYLNYTIGKKTVLAFQYFADGKGFLDFSKKHFLDFTLRGPNQFAFPAIGNYDQYTVSYSYLSKTNITAGDFILRFNNLMEFGRFGRGLKVEQTFGKTNMMVFYQEARFFPNQKEAFGGSYKVNLKGESFVGLNVESKNLIVKGANFRSNLLGATSFIKKAWGTNETEIAVGQAQRKTDFAFFNRLSFKYKRFNINSEIIHAGKEFYGFYTNSLLFANGFNYYLTKKINIGINSNISKINPSLDVLKYAISPYSTTHSAFVSYQPNTKNLFFINYTKQEREDRQKPSTFHYKEDFGNFSYNLNTSKFTLFGQGRYGFAQNLLAIDSTAKRISTAYLLQPTVALLPWLWIGGYFEQQHTSKFSSNNSLQNLYFYGGNIRLNYKKNVNLNLMYRNNYAPDELFEKRSFVDGSLVFDFEKHQLNITAGKAFIPNLPKNDENTLFLSAKYIFKLNMPIKKDKKLGHLSGQIISLSEGINKGGILLKVGQYKILTDSNGRFNFPNLMPNKYFVTLSNESNLAGVVSTIKMPIEVEIKADSTESLTIPLVKTGGVVGAINFESKEKEDANTPSVKPILYIKLYNEKESIITQMNDKNEFSFKEIKPGAWKIKAIIPGKNEQFDIVNQEQEVDIESGKIKQNTFTVKPIERKIKFSGKNFHISSQK